MTEDRSPLHSPKIANSLPNSHGKSLENQSLINIRYDMDQRCNSQRSEQSGKPILVKETDSQDSESYAFNIKRHNYGRSLALEP
jgi:hypothetical protein